MERTRLIKEKKQLEKNQITDKIKRIREMNEKDLEKKNDNLIKIIANPILIWNAYEKIKKNKGSMTAGTDRKQTADGFSETIVQEMSKNIIEGEYQWSNIRRKEIPKEGNKKRPLGIPNFKDRIIQENIRLVLETLYEPIFKKTEHNHGFRPKRSTRTAIEKIQQESQGMTYALEGDFKGAYDNVDRNKLMEKIKEKITDKKTIKLIRDSLKVKIEEGKRIKETRKGVPQGGLASPILFNIYMQEFDEKVVRITDEILKKINEEEKRQEIAKSKAYENVRTKINSLKKSMKKNRNEQTKKYADFDKHKEQKKKLRKMQSEKLKTNPISRKRRKLFFSYTRYADDWIIMTNGDKEITNKIKIQITEWTKEELGLEVNQEKTKITDLYKESAKFLGFTISGREEKKIVTYKRKGEEKETRRRVNTMLKIGIDKDRILRKLRSEGIIDEKNKPIHIGKYRILKTWQIIEVFTQKLRGIVNYYYHNITNKSEINHLYYLIKYSCLKTIANRKKTTIRKLIENYGEKIKNQYEEITMNNGIEEKKIKSQEFPKYTEIMDWVSEISREEIAKRIEYRINLKKEQEKKMMNETTEKKTSYIAEELKEEEKEKKLNLRSGYQSRKYCVICLKNNEKENPIETHHVRHLKKKIKGFDEILKIINRKTIPVCKTCHQEIHRGTYNGKSLKEIIKGLDLATI